jgi:hypothetical protein
LVSSSLATVERSEPMATTVSLLASLSSITHVSPAPDQPTRRVPGKIALQRFCQYAQQQTAGTEDQQQIGCRLPNGVNSSTAFSVLCSRLEQAACRLLHVSTPCSGWAAQDSVA